MSLKSQLESLLFVAVKPMTSKELADLAKVKAKEVETALAELSADYKTREGGLTLINNNGHYQITTVAANSALIQQYLKDETTGELSQPSLEALTIIAYRGPIAKLELDKIRGVNCALIIHNLLLRGLIEEKFDKSKNEHFYSVTLDLLRFLGVSDLKDLPDYDKLHASQAVQATLLPALEDDKSVN
jgi:segregation and condensation protein B